MIWNKSRGNGAATRNPRVGDAVADAPVGGDLEEPFHERRTTGEPIVPPVVVPCHICGIPVTLELARLEVIKDGAYHRCPHCDGRSSIRWRDAIVLQVNAHKDFAS